MTVTVDRQEAQDAQAAERLARVDPELWAAMLGERDRQAWKIELIASENYVSAAVLEAQGSWLTNKYAEGQPGKRYYGGCEFVDIVETLAEERALALFPGAEHVNVQPHSGAQANMAAYLAVLDHGDRILGMSLAHGGHLTHGSPVELLGPLVRGPRLRRRAEDERIDYDALEAQAAEVRPAADRRGRQRLPAHHRLRAAGRHRARRRRAADGGHGPHRRASSRPTSTPARSRTPTSSRRRPTRRCADRAAGWSSAAPTSPRRSTRPSSRAPRAVRSCTSSRPRRSRCSRRRTEAFREDQRRTIANAAVLAGRSPTTGARLVSGGTDNHLLLVDVTPFGVTGDGSGAAARRGRHHRQQERHPVRPAAAEHRVGHPRRIAGRDDPGLRRGRDGASRSDHRPGAARP